MPSTHRFQSRLFQTLQTKFYQAQDAVQLRWRQLKVDALWTAQVGLTPLYGLLQVGRWCGKGLKQATGKVRSLSLGLAPEIEADQPIHNILAALEVAAFEVQNLPVPESQSASWQITIQPAVAPGRSLAVACGNLWQKVRAWWGQSSAIAQSTPESVTLAATSKRSLQRVVIQGVASSLQKRRLVLITTENQVLDVLTAEQQQILHQRIIFEIAVALSQKGRHTARRLRASSLLCSQPSPEALLKSTWRQIQQPARAVQAVVQSIRSIRRLSLPAVLSGLLKPASRLSESLSWARGQEWVQEWVQEWGPQWAQSRLQPIAPRLKALRGAIVVGLSAIALAPFTLALPAKAAASPAIPIPRPMPLAVSDWLADPARTRKQWLKGSDLFKPAKPTQGKIRLAPDKTPAILASKPFDQAIADWAYGSTQVSTTGAVPIDVKAAFMGYHYHPLELLLLWLDRIMVWVETQILWLYQRSVSALRSFLA